MFNTNNTTRVPARAKSLFFLSGLMNTMLHVNKIKIEDAMDESGRLSVPVSAGRRIAKCSRSMLG
jgi:hypothetical protein